jgi:hypothetical protein
VDNLDDNVTKATSNAPFGEDTGSPTSICCIEKRTGTGDGTGGDVGLEVRRVLSDQPGSPRFIETRPKRGYQFIAPLSGLMQSGCASKTAYTAPSNPCKEVA